MSSPVMVRQGDVLLIPRGHPAFAEPPPGARRRRISPRAGRVVLAEGEHSGHAHTLSPARSSLAAFLPPAVRGAPAPAPYLLLVVTEEDTLEHQEHGQSPAWARTLVPGEYEVRIQERFDPRRGRERVRD